MQTNKEWWNTAKLLRYVDSQAELNHYGNTLDKYTGYRSFNLWLNNSRTALFKARFWMYGMLFKWHFGVTKEFNFARPGLEMKFACEEAEKQGVPVQFLGPEFDQDTWVRLHHETRMNVPHYFYKTIQYWGHANYRKERQEVLSRMANSEPSQFTEKCIDPFLLNWYVQCMDIYFPKFKKIFIDQRDDDIFKAIDKSNGKKIVVVVNQWHMEGIEHNWAFRYGQMPRSITFTEGINPIGDMNLKQGLFERFYNALHREIASSNIGGTPVTYADWIIGYHRESNWQYEHRDM